MIHGDLHQWHRQLKSTYLCGFPGTSNQGRVLATAGRLPEPGAGAEPGHRLPEALGHGRSLSMSVWFTPTSHTSSDSVVSPLSPFVNCRITIYKALYLEETKAKSACYPSALRVLISSCWIFFLSLSLFQNSERPRGHINQTAPSGATLSSPRMWMWVVGHEAPPARHLLTFVSGKVAPQNDEQAQHGEHHHGHDAANHGVVHRPDGAFFTCSGVCGSRRGRGM